MSRAIGHHGADGPIVLASDSSVPSGVGEHMLVLGQRLSAELAVVLAFADTGAAAHYLERARLAALDAMPIGDPGRFQSWLTEVGAALLHVHAGIGWEGHQLAAAGQAAGIPVVRTEHLPYLITESGQQREHRLSTASLARLIVVSEANAASFGAAGFARSSLVTIRNGIEAPVARTAPSITRAALGIGGSERVVLTVARLTAQKAHAVLIEAARAVLRAAPQTKFLLAGEGPERPALEALIAAGDLGDAILLLGERRDIADLLATADLFVLPSLFEGLPLALLEAMAFGVAAVASRVGGTVEALGPDYPWLVGAGNADNLAAALIAALSDDARRQVLGRRNCARFERHFRAERMASETAALYRMVLAERQGSRATGSA